MQPKSKISIVFTTCVLFSLICIGSCAASRTETFQRQLESYWNGMRWNAPGPVSGMVEEQHRADFMDRLSKQLQSIRVVDYAIVNVSFGKENKSAMATVTYSYYNVNNHNLKNQRVIQHWNYTDRGWLLRVDKKRPQKSKRIVK